MCLFLTVNQTIIKAGSCRVYIQGISAWSFKDTSTLSSMLTSTAAHAEKNNNKHTFVYRPKLCTDKEKSDLKEKQQC